MKLDRRPAQYDIAAVRDNDISWRVDFYEADGSTAHAINTATVVADVHTSGTQVVAIGQSIGGASNNQLTLTLTDTQLGTGTTPLARYGWVLELTEGTDDWTVLAGTLTIGSRGEPGSPATYAEQRFNVRGLVVAVTPL